MLLEVDVQNHGEHTVVTARGEVDYATSPLLRDTINDLVVDGRIHLVLDFSEVSFLDSTGLGALIGARRRVHTFKGSLALVFTGDHLRKLFRITNLEKVFTIHASLEDALPQDARAH